MFNDQFTAQSEKICRIIGHIEDEGLVTLDDCFYINRSLAFGGISRSKVFAHRVFCGVAYEQNES
ncbi:hypothetical protein QNE48_004376 [Vibrio alginolyticus]|nr:hypothetical protein [Vibrio alginolyticus]